MARAIAIRCFCPPLSCTPLSPTCVWNPRGMDVTNVWAFAAIAALMTSLSTTSGMPAVLSSPPDPPRDSVSSSDRAVMSP